MDNIDIDIFLSLIKSHECLWKNTTVNAQTIAENEIAWTSIAYILYDNFDNFKDNQKRFWVNNLKRKWKTILSKYKANGANYELFDKLDFLAAKTKEGDKIQTPNIEIISNYIIEEANEIPTCAEIGFESGKYYYKCVICRDFLSSFTQLEKHLYENHDMPPMKEDKEEQNPNDNISTNIEYLFEETLQDDDDSTTVQKEENIDSNEQGLKETTEATLIETVFERITADDMMEQKEEYVQSIEFNIEKLDETYLEEFKNECPYCMLVFNNEEHSIVYCAEVQKKIRKAKGNMCALRDEGIYHCDRCPRYFNTVNEMYTHRKNHYQICPVCKIRLLNMENHVKSHHKEIEYKKLKLPDSFDLGIFQCNFCERILQNTDDWIKHKQRCKLIRI